MFHQIHNEEQLNPAIAMLQDHLTRSVNENGNTLSSIIERSQTFLACFAVALYMTTIPPYARQTVEFNYANDGASNRNFGLMDGKHGVLIWRPGRGEHVGYGRKGSGCACFIPPQVTLPLILYLGIVRPVELHLIVDQPLRKKTSTDAHLLQTHIFCNSLRRASATSMLWSPDNLEEVLKSGPLKMEAFPHRLLFSAIIERKHAELLQTIQQPSVVDAQGQHTLNTSQMHYAVLQLQHTTGFYISGYMKQLLACQALHTFCFLGKPVAGLVDTTECTFDIVRQIHQHQGFAFNVARDMVATKYKLAMSSPERAAVLSRTAYLNAPFLSRNSLPGCEQDGDELAHVMVSLISATAIQADLSLQINPLCVVRLLASAGTLVSKITAGSFFALCHLPPHFRCLLHCLSGSVENWRRMQVTSRYFMASGGNWWTLSWLNSVVYRKRNQKNGWHLFVASIMQFMHRGRQPLHCLCLPVQKPSEWPQVAHKD